MTWVPARARAVVYSGADLRGRPHARGWRACIAPALVALVAVASGCGGASSDDRTDRAATGDGRAPVGDELTIAQAAPPNSLDPAKINQAFEWYVNLAYEPLIFWGPDGKPKPGLAMSWTYVGDGNRVFDLELRPGVKFSDGSPLTAEAVKASLEYQMKAGGQAQPYLAGKTVKVTGPLSLRITSKSPDPELARELSQDYLAGNIISPKGLEDPERLATTSAGAGPYVLDAAATVPNDRYTYVPNSNYHDPDAIHYRRVVIRVIPNQNSALNALKTGQVDVVNGDSTTATEAESAGLQVKFAPQVFVGLGLLDRAGELAPPLGDVRVRQALNYAIDREKIARALLGKFGTPTEQTVVPGQDGALDETVYDHDPERARQLLAEAGYADGFTLPVLTTTFFGQDRFVQAIAGELEGVGVKLKLTTRPDPASYVNDMVARKFPAVGLSYGGQPMYLQGPGLFLSSAATFNPFGSSDEQVDDLYARAAAAPPDERAELDRQMERRLVEEAWFVPAALSPVFYFARKGIEGIEPSAGQPITNPVWWHEAG